MNSLASAHASEEYEKIIGYNKMTVPSIAVNTVKRKQRDCQSPTLFKDDIISSVMKDSDSVVACQLRLL